ncbi:MAG TPA: type III-A CRISPR-associated RAMP protein Csm5 [Ignavibacteriaceae bacterium]|nr:type III-A CRISPR-associated RAMP protein Csm5 [Ignavibacteriaceae bacterium]
MKVKIKTLTPIHIGTGKKLGTIDYFKQYRISYDKLFELIAEDKQVEFISWIEQNLNSDAMKIQQQFNLDPKDIIEKCCLYSFNGSFQKYVNEGMKDSSNKLFIPGSSLKGSLRTALMYKVLKDKENFVLNYIRWLVGVTIKERKKIDPIKKSADDKLEQESFICGVEREKNNKTEIIYDDQKYDLLKIIKISDSSSVSTKEDGEITELQVYALKKIPAHKSFRTYTESIKDNVELEFDITVDIEFLKKVREELNNPNSEFGKKYFIGIENKLKNLFDIDIKNELEITEEKIVDSLIKSWIDFGKSVSNLERVWVSSIKDKGNANTRSLDNLYNTENKFKVGFGTGFSGMTILPLLLTDENIKQKVFEFYKAVNIGSHTSNKNNQTPLDINVFPFTRKYSNKQNIYCGFGWIKFSKNDIVKAQNNILEEKKIKEQPPNTVLAQIIDDKSKPPKVKILEGEHLNKECQLTNVRLEGLGLKSGARVFVELVFQKKVLQKADYKGKPEE